MIRTVALLFVGIFTTCLLLGGRTSDSHPLLLITLSSGLVWSFSIARDWRTLSQLMIIPIYLLAATMLLIQAQAHWILLGCGAGLIAWDLTRLHQTLASAALIRSKRRLIQNHLRFLGYLILGSAFLSGIGILLKLKLNFVVVTLLLAILVTSLTFSKNR